MKANIDRRLRKIESQFRLDDYDLSGWSDEELEAYRIGRLEEAVFPRQEAWGVAEALRADGHNIAADDVLRRYFWDPKSNTVARKED